MVYLATKAKIPGAKLHKTQNTQISSGVCQIVNIT